MFADKSELKALQIQDFNTIPVAFLYLTGNRTTQTEKNATVPKPHCGK